MSELPQVVRVTGEVVVGDDPAPRPADQLCGQPRELAVPPGPSRCDVLRHVHGPFVLCVVDALGAGHAPAPVSTRVCCPDPSSPTGCRGAQPSGTANRPVVPGGSSTSTV